MPTSNTQYIRCSNCNIRQGVAGDPAIVYFDFNNDTSTGQYRFYIDSNTILHLRPLTTTISNTLEVNTINTNGDNNLVFQRNGSPYMTFQTNRIDIDQPLHLANSLTIDLADKLTIKPSLENAVNIFDITNSHPVVDNPMIRFRCGEGGGETIVCEMSNNALAVSRNLIVGTAYELRTNTVDTNGDATLNINQKNNPFISLQGSTLNRVQVNRLLRVVDRGGSTQALFVESTTGNYMEFRLGNHINAYAAGTPVNGNTLYLNYYSHGNVFLGTTQDTGEDPIPTITINKFSSDTGNAFEVQGNSVFSGTVSTNTLNSESGDLVFERLGTEYMRFQGSDFTIRMNYSVISTNTYIDNHRPTAFGADTFFMVIIQQTMVI